MDMILTEFSPEKGHDEVKEETNICKYTLLFLYINLKTQNCHSCHIVNHKTIYSNYNGQVIVNKCQAMVT